MVDPAYSAAVLASKPSAYWKLTEISGTTMTDSSGSGHDGTYAGAVMYQQNALIYDDVSVGEKSMGFGGTARGTVPYSSWMNSSHLTVEAVICVNGAAGPNIVVERDSNVSVGGVGRVWNLMLSSAGVIGFTVFTSRTAYAAVAELSGALLAIYHVAGVYDGSYAVLYVNGKTVAQAALTGSVYTDATQGISVGNDTAGTLPYGGLLEKIAVYPRALTGQEIQQHYATTAPGAISQPMQITTDLTAGKGRSYFISPKG